MDGVGKLPLGEDGAEDDPLGVGEKWIFLPLCCPRDRGREIQRLCWEQGWERGVNPLSWDNRSILGPGRSCLSPRSLLISGFISINE